MKVMQNKNHTLPQSKNPRTWTNRVLIFTPTRGTFRAEWMLARYGQIIPTNWSQVDYHQWVNSYVPIDYQLADAQNLMAKVVVEGDYKWIVYLEDDNIPPPNLFVEFNNYILKGDIPVVSGLYFTKGYPCEPLIYRGRGNSYYADWKIGDKVWADGVPFGCRLENANLIKEAWKDSPEYRVGDQVTRRVFTQPTDLWFDQDKGGMAARVGTTDLEWCTRCMVDNLYARAGFPEIQKKDFPILVDTNIYVKHIDPSGTQYPTEFPRQFLPDDISKLNQFVKERL